MFVTALTNAGSYQPPNMFIKAWRTFQASPGRILKTLSLIAEKSPIPIEKSSFSLYLLRMFFGWHKRTPSLDSFDDLMGLEEEIAELKEVRFRIIIIIIYFLI